jgi:hypothetical protein
MDTRNENIGELIVERYEALDSEKGTLKEHFQEIADYMLPRKQSVNRQMTAGGKRMSKILDSTAIRGLRILANGLYGYMTPPSTPWFSLTTRNKRLKDQSEIKSWCRTTTQRMHDAINNSNAGLAFHECYTDIGGFGTGVIYVEPGERQALNFTAFNVGRCCIEENAQGIVDAVFRVEPFTARQYIQKFGREVAPKRVMDAFDSNKKNEKFEVVHAVFPREDYDKDKLDRLNMPFANLYVDKEEKKVLYQGGYQEFPYMVPRWEKDSDELWGRGPGMDALPDTKMLNQMRYDDIRAMQKLIDPPLLVQRETSISSTRTSAGSVIYYKSGEKPESLNTGGDYQIAMDAEEKQRQMIMQCFYADLFAIFAQIPDNLQMTATEVRERVEERLMLLGPSLAACRSSFTIPCSQGVLDPLPRRVHRPRTRALAGEGLEVEYVSKLALAMRQVESQAIRQTLAFVVDASQLDRSALHVLNVRKATRGIAERNGTPEEFLRNDREIDALVQAEQKAAAQAQMNEQLKDLGGAIPALGKKIEEGSPLDMARQLIGGGRVQ